MSDGVLIAIIGAAASVVATLISATLGVVVVVMSRRVRTIRDQVENDHATDPGKTTNLREDMDDKHNVLMDLVRPLVSTVRNLVRDIGGMREDMRQLRRDLSHTSHRVDDLEATIPKGSL
jgi:uncharacterized protein YoxC